MTKTSQQILLLMVLLIIFLGAWIATRQTSPLSSAIPLSAPSPAAKTSPTKERLKPVKPPAPAPEEGDPGEIFYNVRDPFRLPIVLRVEIERLEEVQNKPVETIQPTPTNVPAQPPPLKIQGIFWGIARPQAIINRKIVSVGDTVGDSEILSISKEGVQVRYQGREFLLLIPQISSGPKGTFAGQERPFQPEN